MCVRALVSKGVPARAWALRELLTDSDCARKVGPVVSRSVAYLTAKVQQQVCRCEDKLLETVKDLATRCRSVVLAAVAN